MNLDQLRDLYDQGVNIGEYLRSMKGSTLNDEEIIRIMYDVQGGRNVREMEQPEKAAHQRKYCDAVAETILRYCENPKTICEAGVGDGITFAYVLQRLPIETVAYGFDLSMARIEAAKGWLKQHGLAAILTQAYLRATGYYDDSMDVVYTSHAIEPNHGSESEILTELYRVTKQWLILFEPAYEFCTYEQRKRMEHHGYCQNLAGTAAGLGMNVVESRLFDIYASKPENPTGLTVIRKGN